MATSLRSFRAADADAVVALARQAFSREEEQVGNPTWTTRSELESELSDWSPPASETLLVAEEDGDVVGFGGVEAGDSVADLFGPVVAKRAQGRRLGARLLSESIALARAHGASSLDATVGTRNRRGRVLLERNGFRERGAAQAFYALRPQDHRPLDAPPAGAEVRRAGSADVEAVLALYHGSFPEARLPESFVRSGIEAGEVYLSEFDGEPAAFLTIDRADRWIYLVGVTAGKRGRGVGAHLLSKALQSYWSEHGGETLGLAVRADNTPAVRLYRRQGFRPTLLLQPFELAL